MPQRRLSETIRWSLLGGGLTILLVFLGGLQYRDNKQLRDLLQKQMRASLEMSLFTLRFDLEQQLTAICNAFVDPPPQLTVIEAERYVEQFVRWRGTAAHPALVASIYLYQSGVESGATLRRLDSGRPQAKPAYRPEDFTLLRDRLNSFRDHFNRRDAEGRDFGPPHRGRGPSEWYIDEDIPALVHPISAAPRSDSSFLIVRLSLSELAHILPELAQRDLTSNSKLDYQIALVDRSRNQPVLYASDNGFGGQSDRSADVQLNMFGPPRAMTAAQDMQGKANRQFSITLPQTSAPADRDRKDERQRELAPPNSAGQAKSRDRSPLHYDNRPVRLEPLRDASEGEGWTLIARHRSGSVEAAVAALYRHNLTVGFGVLLVLAGTLATMIYSVRRAQQLAAAKMDFVANVSHELRTPLTGIVSAAQNIADGLIDHKERSMRYGSAILGQAQQLSDLVEQILLFSTAEKGRQLYQFDWVNIQDVIEAATAGTATLLRSSGIRVEGTIESELPPIWCDFRALTQCLQNLISNSAKYGGEDRWLGLSAGLHKPQSGPAEVIISVEDHGLGISAQDLPKIFRPFYRSPAVTNAQIHGTGLGLSIVKSMVEAMGGRLSVESQLGKGSKFSVHLPADRTAEHGPEKPGASSVGVTNKR